VVVVVVMMVMVVMVVLKRAAKKEKVLKFHCCLDQLDWECFLMMVYHRGVFYIFLFDIFAHCALFVFVV
jgi:hypothetical protein